MTAALVEAIGQRWGPSDEILALILERLDVLLRVTAQANSSKRIAFGPAFHFPRPGEDRQRHHRAVRPADLARRLAQGGQQ
jgi:hypothetical protein